jgi:hypothetical protein
MRLTPEVLRSLRESTTNLLLQPRAGRDHVETRVFDLLDTTDALTAERNEAREKALACKPRGCRNSSHNPLRWPLCRDCQATARWEELMALLNSHAKASVTPTPAELPSSELEADLLDARLLDPSAVKAAAVTEQDYVAWCRYAQGPGDSRRIVTCDSDEPGAFRVYRYGTVKAAEE